MKPSPPDTSPQGVTRPGRVQPLELLDCLAHFGAGLAVLRVLRRHAPILEVPLEAVHRLCAAYTDRRAQAFDVRHATDTFERVGMDELGLTDVRGGTYDGWKYGPINQDFFHELIRKVPRRAELTFFDVGLGKGLPLMLAGRLGFRRLMGIELSAELVEKAKRNFVAFGKSTSSPVDAELLVGDFMQLELPREPVAFFLNNPFPHYVAELAVRHIEASIASCPRRVVIAYRRPPQATIEQLESSRLLRRTARTPYWCIYESA
jgi:hypothetical protein